MRKFVLAALLGIVCVSSSGCWFYDAEHNRRHKEVILTDIRAIHEDLDFILALDKPSPLAEGYWR
jgi:hypothetical protein